MLLKKDKKTKHTFGARFFVIGCMALLLLLTVTAEAKDLAEYKRNVESLQKKFTSINNGDASKESIDDVFADVAKTLPVDEAIEVDGATININNKWLEDEIAAYNEETDDSKKKLILIGIDERLEAIKLKIDELENAVGDSISKDAEKQKLAEILSREEFGKPSNEEESLFVRFLTWLDSLLKKNAPKEQPKQLPIGNLAAVVYVLQILLALAVIGLIGFLIYKFAPFLFKKFRSKGSREKTDRIILGEKISSDETSMSLFSEAEKLAQEGNLRDAIRKGYIAFLCELGERKLIGLAKHKTNRDYLRSVQRKRELYKNMNGLTLNYERHWYGFEDADDKDWQEFRENYDEALRN